MKLLYITNGISGAGGLERVLSIKASYLAEHLGYQVHILTLNETATPFYEFSSKIKFHNVAAVGNPIKYTTSYLHGIKGVIKAINPDVISVCDDGLKAFFLPKLLGKPCPMIYERHVSKLISVSQQNQTGIKKHLVNFQFKLMDFLGNSYDKFVVLTAGNLKEWNLKNLQVISNPLSFYPAKSSTLEHKKVIAVGKQSYQKGYDRLLEAWQKVAEKHPNWHLEIYGTFASDGKLPQQAKNLNIDQNVHLFAPEKNIQSKYLDASIYVMSSRYEGFGMVLTEAMACGVPCVSFDCPHGPADIISNKKDGILVPNDDIPALAQALITLIEDDQLRQTMGTNAKENVKRYLPEGILQQWDQLFKSVVK